MTTHTATTDFLITVVYIAAALRRAFAAAWKASLLERNTT